MPMQFARTPSGLMVPVAADENGHPFVDFHGYYGGTWGKSPHPFGVSTSYQEELIEDDLSAGTYYLDNTPVPAGTIRVVTNICAEYAGTPVAVNFMVNKRDSAGNRYPLYTIPSVAIDIKYGMSVNIAMTYAERIELQINNCTAGDTANLWVVGFDIDTTL